MATWDITGSWNGEYSYHANEYMPTLPPNIGFTFTVSRGCFGRFQGIVQDDPTIGAREAARVWGRISGTRVRFLKRYPAFYAYLDGKLLPLREQMEKQHGITLDHDVVPRSIRYRGEYDSVSGIVRGSWQIKSGRRFVRSGGRLLTLFLPGGTGDWEMKRQVG